MSTSLVFMVLYLCLAWSAWRVSGAASERREARLWQAMFFMLVALGFDKLFGGVLTNAGRRIAFAQHWYGERQVFQLWFVLAVAVLWLAATTVLMISARRVPTATRVALLGTTMLIAFALIKDISLHQIDALIGARVIGVKISWIVELAGFALILLSHARRWKDTSNLAIARSLRPAPRRSAASSRRGDRVLQGRPQALRRD